MDQVAEFAHHGRNAAGVVEILHQEFARRHQVHQQREIVAQAVEIVEVELHAHAARDRQQVDHGVAGSADGGVHADRILERLARQDLRDRRSS